MRTGEGGGPRASGSGPEEPDPEGARGGAAGAVAGPPDDAAAPAGPGWRVEEGPSLPESFAAVWKSARTAWKPALLLPVWFSAVLCWWIWDVGVARLASRPGGVPWALELLAWAATVALCALAWAMVTVVAGFDFGRGERLGWLEALAVLAERWRSLLGAFLFAPAGVALLLGTTLGGGLLLSRVPFLGKPLAALWLALPGTFFTLLAAGLFILGLPAVPLIVSAGSLELPYAFDAASRAMSYVRARPSRYLALVATALGTAALGTVVFAAFALLAAGALSLGWELAARGAGVASLQSFLGELWQSGRAADPFWPLFSSAAPLTDPAGGPALGATGWLAALAFRAVAGYALAALGAAAVRIYLLLRWELDGESPAALLRPGEEFRWADE
jgi:hypothetical protein